MEYSYQFRLYPNKEQEQAIQRTFGSCRFVYNHFLDERQKRYKETGKAPSKYQQMKELPILKQQYEWLKECDSMALQAATEQLDTAFQNFFRRVKNKEKPGYPHFRSKKNPRKAYKSKCVNANIKVFQKSIQLPKLGIVKCRISKEVRGRILSATISQHASGKYFVSLCCTDVKMELLPKTSSVVGLNMGLKSFATDSDGKQYVNHKYLAASEKKLKRLQRQLSRKSKGSRNHQKAQLRLARAHEHIANQRKDSMQKLSTQLIRDNDIICLEDLAPKNMVKNHCLAKAISDAAWGEFFRELEYKAKWYGKKVVKVGGYFPFSLLCSACGAQWPGTKNLAVGEWTCPECGAVHDRDTNAARNILYKGLHSIA